MNRKPTIWWTIKTPEDWIHTMFFPWATAWTRNDAIKLMEKNYRNPWKKLYRKGYRAVKIEVREIER